MVWLTHEMRLALFPVGAIVKDSHHRESPERRKHDLNQCGILVQALLNEVEQ